jgi:hypothetical protein
MQKTEVAHLHEASGEDVLEEPAYKLEDVEADGAQAGTSWFAVGEGYGALHEAEMRKGDIIQNAQCLYCGNTKIRY